MYINEQEKVSGHDDDPVIKEYLQYVGLRNSFISIGLIIGVRRGQHVNVVPACNNAEAAGRSPGY